MQLVQAAHTLGDEYYRCITHASRSEDGAIDKCLTIAQSYLTALESLRAHLARLKFDSEVETLIRTTDGHLNLLRNDLQRFRTRLPH